MVARSLTPADPPLLLPVFRCVHRRAYEAYSARPLETMLIFGASAVTKTYSQYFVTSKRMEMHMKEGMGDEDMDKILQGGTR